MSETMYERIYPLSIPPYVFVGTKPAAVLFGEERVEVKSWRQVYAVIIGRCNQDPACHEMLLYLRNKAAGKVRMFLSDSAEGMRRPLQIDDSLFAETHYGSETLIHILTIRILAPAHFDYSDIRVAIKG